MSKVYHLSAAIAPSEKDNSYIYAIVPVVDHGLAVITSADELILLDRRNLSRSPTLRLANVPHRVSCLVSGDSNGTVLLCSGGDGSVATFDVRSQNRVNHFTIGKPITSLACNGNHIALGTEFASHQAIVSVWDQRQNKQLWLNSENSDDITALDFHRSKSNLLLAGGDDGQLSVFDTNVADEDDSLLQGVNHGPIHKAGFLGDDRFFALSSDQNLSIYPVSSLGDQEDPTPNILGDLRPLIPCEYVINVFESGDGYAIAAGSNINNQRVDIVELRHAANPNKEPKLKSKSGYVLEGAHGEEVVRSVMADELTGTMYTAGEDGRVQAFKLADTTAAVQSAQSVSNSKIKKTPESRYKPY